MFGELANLNTVLVKLNKNPYLPPKLEANERKIVPSRHMIFYLTCSHQL